MINSMLTHFLICDDQFFEQISSNERKKKNENLVFLYILLTLGL